LRGVASRTGRRRVLIIEGETKMKKLVPLLASLLLAGAANATPIPGSEHYVAAWQIGAYTHDNTGAFSHCAMSTAYRSGITMYFAVSANYTWRVGWSHPSWNLTKGQKINIALYIDGSAANWVTAVAYGPTLAFAELPATASLFDLFRKGYHLTVMAQGNRYDFNLDGTYAALTDLGNCVARYEPGRAQPSANPPPIIGSAQPPVTPHSASTSAAPTVPASLTAEQRLEATTLVANLLSQGDLTGYRILSPKDVQELKVPALFTWDVVWRSEDVLGAMRIVPSKIAGSTSAIASAMISGDSKDCSGSFASGSTPDDKSKGTTRVFTVCKTDKQAWEAHYIVTPRDDGGFYLFATFGRAASSEAAASSSNHADGLLRAAVFEVLKH
jgi:hypothetical protein